MRPPASPAPPRHEGPVTGGRARGPCPGTPLEGEPGEARAAAAAALVLADGGEDVAAVASARSVLGHALLGLGDLDGAVETADLMLQDLPEDGDQLARARASLCGPLRRSSARTSWRPSTRSRRLSRWSSAPPRPASRTSPPRSRSRRSSCACLCSSRRSPCSHRRPARVRHHDPHRLLAVRSLVAVRLLWAARLELLGERPAAGEQYALTASAALLAGPGRPAVAPSAPAARRRGRRGLRGRAAGRARAGCGRARAALAAEPNPGAGARVAPGPARPRRMRPGRRATSRRPARSPRSSTARTRPRSGDALQAEAVLWEGLIEPGLARIAAPGPAGRRPDPRAPCRRLTSGRSPSRVRG